MPVRYSPAAHSTPHTSTLDGVTIRGQGPGGVLAQLSGDQHSAPTVVWVATRLDPDGQPGGMVPVTISAAGTVS